MRLRVLGTAAGGGLPQWNCGCVNCRAARQGRLPRRTHSSLAFTPDEKSWYLIDAGPEVGSQLLQHKEFHPDKGSRIPPLAGIFLTDAELDHTLGLLQLREGAKWRLYATASVLKILSGQFPVFDILQNFSKPTTCTVNPEKTIHLGELSIQYLPLSDHTPRYHYGRKPEEAAVSALVITGKKKLVYAPCVSALTPQLEQVFAEADIVLVDGTFFYDDEIVRLGFSHDTSLSMGHLPVGGEKGSALQLAKLPTPVICYIHINNTNPLLNPESSERKWIRTLGLDLADDGWVIEL